MGKAETLPGQGPGSPKVGVTHLTKWNSAQSFRSGRLKPGEGGKKMIGMSFGGFLVLLILGLIATIVMHSIIRYRVLGGVDGFVAKWIAGWVGGWLGSPVLGHWWFQIQNIYVVPALVGAFIGAFLCVAFLKASALSTTMVTREKSAGTTAIPEMLRKAG